MQRKVYDKMDPAEQMKKSTNSCCPSDENWSWSIRCSNKSKHAPVVGRLMEQQQLVCVGMEYGGGVCSR